MTTIAPEVIEGIDLDAAIPCHAQGCALAAEVRCRITCGTCGSVSYLWCEPHTRRAFDVVKAILCFITDDCEQRLYVTGVRPL